VIPPRQEITGVELSDRDRLLLAFANLASHGIAARPAMASDAARLAAELGARHPRGLGSYVFWHHDNDASFDPTGTLTTALTLHCSGEEALTAARAACRQVGVDVVRAGRSHTLTATSGQARTGRLTHPTPATQMKPQPRAPIAVALTPLGAHPPSPDGARTKGARRQSTTAHSPRRARHAPQP